MASNIENSTASVEAILRLIFSPWGKWRNEPCGNLFSGWNPVPDSVSSYTKQAEFFLSPWNA